MPKSKNVTIDYTSREFDTIKEDLVDFAKRFYPENYKDFTTPSFGSMVLDSVAYVGDILSYYVDYAVNESFIDTAVEFGNVRRHARALGYRYKGSPSSFGTIALFVIVPANSTGTAPDTRYLPTVKRGSSFSSTNGGNYVLTEDVLFNDPKTAFVAAKFNSNTGATTYFACKAYGQVQSGAFRSIEVDLNDQAFERFKRVQVSTGGDISEIMSVWDAEGNKYYEVDHLAQEVVFVETTNKNAAADGVRSILKPFVASRKFVVYQDDTGTFLQFGFGSENDDTSGLLEPSKIALKMHGKNTITDTSFDPTKLLSTNKLGIAPYNTSIEVRMRTNDGNLAASASNTITNVGQVEMKFEDITALNAKHVDSVRASLESTNEELISAVSRRVSSEELKERAKAYYAAQDRAVTKRDYESLIYQMPPKFGAVKRANIVNDPSSTNRQITLYVVSEDNNGNLTDTNQIIKNNIKNYLSHYIPINDAVEIRSARIVNFSIDFTVMNDRNYDSDSVMFECHDALEAYFEDTLYIGEPLYLTRLYDILNRVAGVADVKRVKILPKYSGIYSDVYFNIDEALSKDGTYIKVPKNVILELKYPRNDIKGTVR